MTVLSTDAITPTLAVVIPPSFVRAGETPLIEGDHWVRTVIFKGRYEDHAITAGSTPHHWTVAAPNGTVYELRDIPCLRFDDKLIDNELTLSYETGSGQSLAVLNTNAWGLALVHGLLGAPATADPALVGKLSAYVSAQGLGAVLERLDADGTLASLAGSTGTDTLLAFAYKNFMGHDADADTLTALRAEINAMMNDWRYVPETPANVLYALLTGPSVAQFYAQQPATFSYDWFTGPLLGTDGRDGFRAPSDGGILDLGDGVDSVHFGEPYWNAHTYTAARAEDGSLTVRDDQGNTWLLHNVERLELGPDQWRAFDLEGDGAAGQAARLMGASLGAEAVHDSRLAAEVLSRIDAHGVRDTVQSLVDQGVFTHLAGGDSLEALLGLLYRNVTGAGPSQEEMAGALDWLESQNWSATDAILYAAELPQTAALIGLPELAQQGWGYSFGYAWLA